MPEQGGQRVEALLGVAERDLCQRLLLRVVVDVDVRPGEDFPPEVRVLDLVLAEGHVLGREWRG
jgi:hypothetical protein